MRTLLVYDDPATQASLLKILQSRGHVVTACEDAVAGWKAYARRPHSLVITDLLLPGKSGLGLCMRIRQHSQSRNTTLLMCTAAHTHEDLDAVLNAGADDYLTKPFDEQQFTIRLRIVEQQISSRIERQISEESINRLLRHVTCSQESVVEKTLDGEIVSWNARATEMFGYTPEEARGKATTFLLPDDRKDEVETLLAGILAGEEVFNFETVRIHKDGTPVDVSISIYPVKNEQNEIIGYSTISRDISVQLKIQTDLRLSDARSRRLFDSDLMGIVFWNLDGRVIDANATFLRMIDYTRTDALSGNLLWSAITPPEWADMDKKAVSQLLISGQALPYEKELLRRDGSRVPVLVGPVIFEGSKSEGGAFILDLTVRKQLESQLRQTSKMEAIGRLAGGVAHDFNNLLTVIIGRSELIAQSRSDDPKLVAEINLIKATGEKAVALTRQLLQFSRQQLLQPKVVSISSILTEMKEMLRRLIRENIELAFVPNAVHSVKVDPTQVQQIVMNLCINARDAISQDGKIVIETADVYLGDEYAVRHLGVTPGHHVMLAVTDNGHGMNEKTKARLFEPFFTTKDVGKGTGLGLSTVFGIVQQSGGTIWVYSEPQHGTTFKLYFPVTQDRPAPVSSALLPMVQSGAARILVVEDDKNILELIHDVLTDLGYQVAVANTLEEAIAHGENKSLPVDLLLTDVVMPKMNGMQLAAKLSAMRPTMKILFMSGYSSTAVVQQGILSEGTDFLEKPFTPTSLGRKVQAVLDLKKQ